MEFKEILEKLAEGEDLTEEEASAALRAIISGEIENEPIAAFLFGMRAKGETTEELTAFVKVMREAAVRPEVNLEGAVDLCGTGGDASGTFNISTAAMFVTAGAGVPVLKHGNRSVSSKSGSADVLEAMGAVATLRKEQVEEVFDETSMAFMFAPYFHPAMKHVMPARRSLGIRTFFNVLGPVLNPAGVRRQIVGAFSKEVARQIVHILANLDTEFAYTVNAHDGLDEVSLTAQSEIFELKDQLVTEAISFDPRSLDFKWVEMDKLLGGDADQNAGIIRSILEDKAEPAQRDIVLLNATFGIHAAGKVEHLTEAKDLALESIRSGAALKALNRFIEATNDIKENGHDS
jgi:anthranilate phosphoribosyltransferase